MTRGVKSTTSKSPASKAFKPLLAKMSSWFQTNFVPDELTIDEAPVTYIAVPISASTRPYCCIAWAMICDSAGMAAILLLTAVVFASRSRRQTAA